MSRPIGVSKKSMMENYASEVARCYTDSGLNFLYEDFIWRAPLVVVMVYLIRFSPRFLVSKIFFNLPSPSSPAAPWHLMFEDFATPPKSSKKAYAVVPATPVSNKNQNLPVHVFFF